MATTSEPTHCNYWSPLTHSLCSATHEATAMRSLLTTTRESSHSKEDPAQPKEKKNRRDCKRISWNHRAVLTLFIQLRKTAVVGKGLVKTTIFSAILRPIKRWIRFHGPSHQIHEESDTGNAVVAKQPRRVLRVLKEVSSFYLHIGPSENMGHKFPTFKGWFFRCKI